jgi:hypothetical protein
MSSIPRLRPSYQCLDSPSRLDLGGSTADALGLRALQVRGRDPALVVLGARGDSRAIGTDNGDLLGGVDLLGALGRLLGALTTLAASLLLGEEGGDPGVVDEVDGSSEGAEEDEVEEDAGKRISHCLPSVPLTRTAHGRLTSEGRTGWWASQR